MGVPAETKKTTASVALGLAVLAGALLGHLAFGSLGRSFGWTLALQGIAFAGFALCIRAIVNGAWTPGFGFALALVCGLRLLALPLEPTLSDDVYRYVWEGRVALAGENPYLHAPTDERLTGLRDDAIWPRINHAEIPAAYPPFLQAALRLGVRIHDTPFGQKLVFGLADVAAFALLWLLLHQHRRPPGLALIYGLAPLPIVEFSGMAHSDSLTLLTMLAALLAHRRRLGLVSGVLLGCAAATKFLPLCVLPFFVRRNGWTPALGAFATLLGLAAPWIDWDDPLRVLTGTRAYADLPPTGGSLYPLLLSALGSAAIVKAILAALALAVLATGWRQRLSAERFTAWLGLFFLACSPTVHPWYVAAYLLPVCCFVRSPLLLLTTWTIVGSYHLLPRWIDERLWLHSFWWSLFAWAPFWLALLLRGRARRATCWSGPAGSQMLQK